MNIGIKEEEIISLMSEVLFCDSDGIKKLIEMRKLVGTIIPNYELQPDNVQRTYGEVTYTSLIVSFIRDLTKYIRKALLDEVIKNKRDEERSKYFHWIKDNIIDDNYFISGDKVFFQLADIDLSEFDNNIVDKLYSKMITSIK